MLNFSDAVWPRTSGVVKNVVKWLPLSSGLVGMAASGLGAADGPGLPNVSYPQDRVGEILSIIDPQKAVSAATLHRGYLFVPLGADHGGGQGSGAFAFYNVSDPTKPVSIYDSRNDAARFHELSSPHYVGDWAEIHHLTVSGDLMMMSERRNGSAGFSIFDASPFYDEDPATKPRTLSKFSFQGVTSPTNYDGFSFALAWQGSRYVYAPTGAQGLYIVDTKDLSNPVQLKHVSRAALGNVTLRSVWVIGNLLILAEGDVQTNFQARIFDVSDPGDPKQLSAFSGPFGYNGFVYGSSFYGGGSPIARHDFTDPSNVVRTDLLQNPGFDRPEYGYGHDGHIFIGHYPGATKWKLNENTVEPVSRVNSGLVDDHAFLNPLGNLVMLCSDHNNDRKMMIGIHGTEKDVLPPRPLFVSPVNGATGQNVLSRIGISFSDYVDPASLNASTVIVRNFGTGEIIPGSYSAMMGIVNFVPDAPLATGTTYDVVLAANGVRDPSGNSVPNEVSVTRFSTGASVNDYTVSVSPTTPRELGSTVDPGLSVVNNSGLALEHSWDFGDGSTPTSFSSATSVSHTYTVPGNHSIMVRTRIAGQTYAPGTSGVQVIHAPIPAQAPVNHTTIVVDPSRAMTWNVNPDNDTVTGIDTNSFMRKFEVAVGDHPVGLAIGPSDTLWVVNKDSGSLSVINRANGAVIRTLSFNPGSAPHGIVVDLAAAAAYVSLEGTGKVVKISTTSGYILQEQPVGPWPRGLALDPVRKHLWVSRFISPDEGGVVTRMDLETFTVTDSLLLPPVMTPDGLQNGRGIPNYLASPVLSPDLTQAFIPSKKDNIFRGMQRDGEPLTFEHTVRSMASRIDLTQSVVVPSDVLDFDNSDFATAMAFSPLGNMMYFATSGSKTIWAMDAYKPSSNYTFDAGGRSPDGLAVSVDGTRLYVHNFMDRSVTVFRSTASCGGVCGTAPQIAKVITVMNEKIPAKILLGKQIFYDASDPRVSQEGYMSCASCHLDGGHDGRVWDFTNLGEGMRNTIDLTGRGVGHGPSHWTGNFDELQDFEGQIRDFASGSGLMPAKLFHQGTRSLPLGEGKTGISPELDALAAYMASLRTVGISPHRKTDGGLSQNAAMGREIFRQENCSSCHGGQTFTDSASLIRHDVGTATEATGSRLAGPFDGFDTPTLRGLWKSAPYLHDGSAATLREVLINRDLSGHHGNLFHRTESEIERLVAYLNSIDDLEFAAPAAIPGTPPSLSAAAAREDQIHRAVTVEFSVSGNGPFTWQALALPPGLELDPTTGEIKGAPSRTGIYTARIAVRDAAGRTNSLSFQWTIVDPSAYRFAKLVSLSSHGGQSFTTVAELNLLDSYGVPLNRDDWSATANTQETVGEFAPASNVLDGINATFWHNEWQNGPDLAHPHELVLDLGEPRAFSRFTMLPRQDGNDSTRIRGYRFHVSGDGVNWGAPVAQGNFANSNALQTVTLSTASQVNRAPAFQAPLPMLSIAENSAAASLVGTVSATDPDAGQSITYSLGSGNADGIFQIDPTTGAIRIASPPDYEKQSLYHLQVIARDSAAIPFSTSVTLPVIISNVIEDNAEIVHLALNGTIFPGHGNPSLIGFDADPDRDGVPNAIEILLGTNPAVAGASPPVHITHEEFEGETYMAYEFEIAQATGLVCACHGSSDGIRWKELESSPVLIGVSNGIARYRVRDDKPVTVAPSRFMRIGVGKNH